MNELLILISLINAAGESFVRWSRIAKQMAEEGRTTLTADEWIELDQGLADSEAAVLAARQQRAGGP